MPITCMENVVSNAERRAIRNHEPEVVPRISDVYASLPAITGKFELEYEGELKGADQVARELIRSAVGKVFQKYFDGADLQQIVQWFELGGTLKISESVSSAEVVGGMKKIQGLTEKSATANGTHKASPGVVASAGEFLLEGLHAHRRIGRSEERGFVAEERRQAQPSREDLRPPHKHPYN
jgi:magnesium chelatase subunit I